MKTDIAIVGGGMVGATLAGALRNSQLDVVMIDPGAAKAPASSTRFDLRVSAITRASQRVFEQLHVWPAMLEEGVSPFREMHVWEQSGRGEMHFDSAELSEPYLGHIIENRVILSALYDRLREDSNVTLLTEQHVQHMALDHEGWQLTLSDGEQIDATLVVGADGSRSWVRQQAGISVKGWDYDQRAVVTYVKTSLPHQETAWQRFLPAGPLAFLPLLDGYSSIVWSTSPQHADQLLAMDDTAFGDALSSAYEGRLGEIEDVGPRAAFPLRFLVAEHYVGEHLALIGDAAHTIHPLAGQGVNLGILDAASLAQVLMTAHGQHQTMGSHSVLRKYERWRKAENMDMLVMVDQIQRWFGIQDGPIPWLRNLGLSVIDHSGPLKNVIIEHAMGNRGDLPHIAR